MVVYKNKGLVVGGVYDKEGPQHTLSSTFYNDMYAFDMERKRYIPSYLPPPNLLFSFVVFISSPIKEQSSFCTFYQHMINIPYQYL